MSDRLRICAWFVGIVLGGALAYGLLAELWEQGRKQVLGFIRGYREARGKKR